MHDSKLLKLMEAILADCDTFDLTRRQQQNHLRRFVASPFVTHEKNALIVPLFDYVVVYLATPDHPALARERICAHLYADQPFNDKTYTNLRRVMGALIEVLEEYVAYTHLKRDEWDLTKHIVAFYDQYPVDGTSFDHWLQKMQHINQQSVRNINAYYRQFYWASSHFRHRSRQPGDETPLLDIMTTGAHNLDLFFILSKLEAYTQFLTLRKKHTHFAHSIINPNVLALAQQSPYNELPIVQLHYNAFMLLYDPQPQGYFETFQQLLTAHADSLHPIELQNFYISAENYCTMQILAGKTDFYKSLFELYRQQLQDGVMYNNGYLDIRKFKNIVTLAVWLHEFEFAAAFIQKEQIRLDEPYRMEAYHYCLACLHFGKQEYDQVSEHLRLAQQDKRYFDLPYRTDSHKLEIKMYYECRNENLLAAKLNTFTAFIRNNLGQSGNSRIGNQNFVRVMRKLLAVINLPLLYGKREAQGEKVEKLLAEIRQLMHESTQLVERPWLEEKLQELE